MYPDNIISKLRSQYTISYSTASSKLYRQEVIIFKEPSLIYYPLETLMFKNVAMHANVNGLPFRRVWTLVDNLDNLDQGGGSREANAAIRMNAECCKLLLDDRKFSASGVLPNLLSNRATGDDLLLVEASSMGVVVGILENLDNGLDALAGIIDK